MFAPVGGWLPSFANALTEVPINILQVVVGSIFAPLALTAASRVLKSSAT
jgi:hypothetical protein